ncbi:MAG: DUF190 domain-containing protein [Phreatobacter sp.]|nr:DUF190 domain-containing protein [Phreatobacter sp.]
MTPTERRKKVDILADRPLVRRIVEIIERSGVTGHTVLPVAEGGGYRGIWSDDQVSGASAKMLVFTITTAPKAEEIVEALTPLLETHSLRVWLTDVEVIRPERF